MPMPLITVGKKLPDWVNATFFDYNKRLPHDYRLDLIELPAVTRTKSTSVAKAVQKETDAIRKKLPPGAFIILLDEGGRQYSSTELAACLAGWQETGKTPCFIIGGADGVDAGLQQSADICWCLSSLTFPHALVRVILIEQIYRAWSINANHPYHRA